MALSRRTGHRFQASIWPGFVDAMTGLLLVLMFVLTIFMVVQFVLRETITGQENELNLLSAEIAAIAEALGLDTSGLAWNQILPAYGVGISGGFATDLRNVAFAVSCGLQGHWHFV